MDDEGNTVGDDNKPEKLSLKSLNSAMEQQAGETEERLGAIESSVGEMLDLLKGLQDQSHDAIDNPVIIDRYRGQVSEDLYAGENTQDVQFTQGRPEDDVDLVRRNMGSVHEPEFKNKIEQMKFDNELIEVLVMQSSSQFPDNTFTLSVNGRDLLIVRGKRQWIPRNYAEVMAQARVSTYANIETFNDRGERTVENPETSSARYIFQVVTDRNPLGPQWLERVMNQQVTGLRRSAA